LFAKSAARAILASEMQWLLAQERRQMRMQARRSWVLLTSFAACAGLAALPVFAVEPPAVNTEVQPQDDVLSQDNTRVGYLIKMLEGSSQFRVRALAASALGQLEPSSAARRALTNALRDEYPAVRAAAAAALGRIGEPKQVSALRELERDPEEPVRHAAHASIGKLAISIEEFPAVFYPGAPGSTRL